MFNADTDFFPPLAPPLEKKDSSQVIGGITVALGWCGGSVHQSEGGAFGGLRVRSWQLERGAQGSVWLGRLRLREYQLWLSEYE